MVSVSDRDLVERTKRGDNHAFDELVRRHFSTVYAVAMARLRHVEAAEDLAQEVFLRILLNLSNLNDGARFGAWSVRLARNLSVDRLRRGRVRSEVMTMIPFDEEAFQVPDETPNARDAAISEEERRRMEAAIWELPETQREMVLLHFMEGMTRKDIAERLGVHPATVGRQLDGALAKVRESMESRMHDALAPRRSQPRAIRKAAALSAVVMAMAPEARAAIISEFTREAATAKVAAEASAFSSFSLSGFLQTIGGYTVAGGSGMGATKLAVGGVLAAGLIGGGYMVTHGSGDDGFERAMIEETAKGKPLDWIDFANLQTIDFKPGPPVDFIIPNRTAKRIKLKFNGAPPVDFVMANHDGVMLNLRMTPDGLLSQRMMDSETIAPFEGWSMPPVWKKGELMDVKSEYVCLERLPNNDIKFYHQEFKNLELEREINKLMAEFTAGKARIQDVAAKAEKVARRLKAGPEDPVHRERYYKALHERVINNRWNSTAPL